MKTSSELPANRRAGGTPSRSLARPGPACTSPAPSLHTDRRPENDRSAFDFGRVRIEGDDGSSRSVHAAALRGTASSGDRLPFFDRIQRSFGRHDVSGVRAHVGGAAAEASRAMSASAYAVGDAVAFAGPPSLRTAAHEAAHVIQQRAGVRLPGGVGRVGDAYERHADTVADAVARQRSAESLLNLPVEAGGRGVPALQYQQREGAASPEPSGERTSHRIHRSFNRRTAQRPARSPAPRAPHHPRSGLGSFAPHLVEGGFGLELRYRISRGAGTFEFVLPIEVTLGGFLSQPSHGVRIFGAPSIGVDAVRIEGPPPPGHDEEEPDSAHPVAPQAFARLTFLDLRGTQQFFSVGTVARYRPTSSSGEVALWASLGGHLDIFSVSLGGELGYDFDTGAGYFDLLLAAGFAFEP